MIKTLEEEIAAGIKAERVLDGYMTEFFEEERNQLAEEFKSSCSPVERLIEMQNQICMLNIAEGRLINKVESGKMALVQLNG